MADDVVRGPDDGPSVLVLENREQMWAFMVGRFREISERAMRERGRFSAALSGGKTPEDFYLEMGRVGQDMEWRNIHIFLVDERFVPRGDDRSNYGMIKRTLLDKVPIPAANVHPIETEESDLSDIGPEIRSRPAKILRYGSGGYPCVRHDPPRHGAGRPHCVALPGIARLAP